jgi:hypothetical protein
MPDPDCVFTLEGPRYLGKDNEGYEMRYWVDPPLDRSCRAEFRLDGELCEFGRPIGEFRVTGAGTGWVILAADRIDADADLTVTVTCPEVPCGPTTAHLRFGMPKPRRNVLVVIGIVLLGVLLIFAGPILDWLGGILKGIKKFLGRFF